MLPMCHKEANNSKPNGGHNEQNNQKNGAYRARFGKYGNVRPSGHHGNKDGTTRTINALELESWDHHRFCRQVDNA